MSKKIISMLVATFCLVAGLACTQQGYGKCGKCQGCNYVVVCGSTAQVGPDGGSAEINIQICSGNSQGALDPDCSSGHPFGSYYCLTTLSVCGAPVQLTGNCCNGSRTTTKDMSLIFDSSPKWPGCNNRS